jgi:hypothetical protein
MGEDRDLQENSGHEGGCEGYSLAEGGAGCDEPRERSIDVTAGVRGLAAFEEQAEPTIGGRLLPGAETGCGRSVQGRAEPRRDSPSDSGSHSPRQFPCQGRAEAAAPMAPPTSCPAVSSAGQREETGRSPLCDLQPRPELRVRRRGSPRGLSAAGFPTSGLGFVPVSLLTRARARLRIRCGPGYIRPEAQASDSFPRRRFSAARCRAFPSIKTIEATIPRADFFRPYWRLPWLMSECSGRTISRPTT